jgi:hypothetical protein
MALSKIDFIMDQHNLNGSLLSQILKRILSSLEVRSRANVRT